MRCCKRSCGVQQWSEELLHISDTSDPDFLFRNMMYVTFVMKWWGKCSYFKDCTPVDLIWFFQ